MALITITPVGGDAQPVIGGVIALPRMGVWHAELKADTDVDFDGETVAISINGGELGLVGTVTRALPYEGVTQLRVVAGAGGMQKAATPKFYGKPTAAMVLADLAEDAEVAVSEDTDDLTTEFTAWTTIAAPLGGQLTELLRPLGAVWRLLPDGSLWAGVEAWPASEVDPDDWQTMEYDHWNGVLELGVVAPTLLPGTTLGSDLVRIDRVEHIIEGDSVRTRAWVPRDNRMGASAEADTTDARPGADFRALGRGAVAGVEFLGLYAAEVKAQSKQTFDLQPDDPRLPAMSGIPIRHGFPGLTVQVAAGARLLVGWRNGDPREPFCGLWGGGEGFTQIQIGGPDLVAAQHGLVLGKCIDPFTGATHFALGGVSSSVMAKE